VYLPEVEVSGTGGVPFPVRLVGNRLMDDGRQSIGMAFSIQDLSQIKKLEMEKIEAERMAVVGETVADLAHGLKNLVNALDGGLYMLNSGLSTSDIDRLQKGLETLVRNTRRISTVVKSFLNFAKGRSLNIKSCDIGEIVEEAAESFTSRASQSGIDIACEIPEKMEPAMVDSEGIRECLTNLVGNALDACGTDDHKDDGHKVVISAFEENRVIIFQVSDNGCGMDEQTRAKIFTKFFTTKGLGGTGLGLLMTKKIIQEHGGTIDMISAVGKGTTFRIHLPRRRLNRIAGSS